ncbi:MAG: cupin domain-containing protein [Chitinophagaceae bacterium]|nr:cupin domain-containing protein [Chitinophagaceae bacterium]MDP1764835.1 cupin domain-containing protein [Sediminibacterium sp.]MDP1810384.1 cupin domain-containing protein [Sediminibacterium sp.]MDP3665308.1 cupin domain-containing protein [Sediminibacterium sp.]
MERRNFLSTGILGGFTFLNLPTFAYSQTQEDKDLTQPFNIPPSEPLKPGPGNVDFRTIIHSKQTNKQISNVEVAVSPKQMGPSPHIHKELDELMYVLEGTATVMIGKEIYEVQAGGWNFRPRGIVHSFWNASDKPLRFIDSFFNQNFEDYLEDLFHKIIPEMVKKNLTPASPEISKRIEILDKKFGVTWFHNERQAIIDKYGLKA